MEGGRQATLRGVLFTDMVGSSELRSRLGDDRADALRRDLYALVGSAVTTNGGRVLRWTGDGVKADFPTASGAVAAAVDMQRAVADYSRGADAVSPFQLRIGLSAGEVVIEGNEAHGLAVVEAARLEPLAAPGEILATDLVRRLGDRRTEARFEELGPRDLKGLDVPVDVLRVVDGAGGPGTPFARTLVVDRRFPLVGRTAELTEAGNRWTTARTGTTATVLVSGPSGIGKSRFIAQLADRTHRDGALVLAGACDADLALPYQPFVTAFAGVPDLDDELTAALADGEGALGPLFPTRRVGLFDDPGPAARFELFQAVVALVGRLAGDQPVVIVLDDLHWATGSTIQLIRHLMAHARSVPLLLVCGFRSEELPPGHALRELLGEHRRDPDVSLLELAPLTQADVAELVTAQVPYADDAGVRSFTRQLFRESAGSPFFTCELLHHLSGTNQLEHLVGQEAGDELPIPDSVRDVVDQRLGRLPEDDARLLAAAAVVGASFDVDLLAAVTGRPPDAVLESCEDLDRVALVQEVGAERFAFAHAIVRATVLDGLSASRLARAHRRVAEAIEALGRADHDELAHHWLQAGEPDRASASLELAAQRDLDALSFESAAERYRSLLDHRRGGDDDRATARDLLGLGLAQRATGDPAYFDLILEAGRLGRRLRDVEIVADAAVASIWPGNFFAKAGRVDEPLVELAEDALALLPDGDARRPRVLSTLAAHLTFGPDRARRASLLEDALAEAEQRGDPELVATALTAEYVALWTASTHERRTEIATAVRRLARMSGNVDHEFLGGFFTAIGETERGELVQARTRLVGLDDAITASQNFYFRFLAERLVLSIDTFTAGDDLQARSDDLAARYGDTHADTEGTWAIQAGFLALQAGTFAEVAVPILRPMVEGTAIGGNWVAAYGYALLRSGDVDAAAAVLDDFEDPPPDYFWLTTLQIASELAVGLERVDRCKAFYESLLPYRSLLGITASGSLCFGLVATTLGQLALGAGDPAAAVDLLDEAVARADAIGAPFEAVRARRNLVTALRLTGRPDAELEPIAAIARAEAERRGYVDELALLG